VVSGFSALAALLFIRIDASRPLIRPE
jgi:hypothetical protein